VGAGELPVTTSDWIVALNGIAILLAPLVALWIGGILQRRSDSYRAKLDIFGTLIGLRHQPLSSDLVRALNLIDVVFADDAGVREAWTKYLAALNDGSFNEGPGFAIREEKRRDLLLQIVRALGLSRKISSAELLRSYMPAFALETQQLEWLERLHKRALYQDDLKKRGIAIPSWLESNPPGPSFPSIPPPGGSDGRPPANAPAGTPPSRT
jgi:Family of unknown function (DUF6680)